MKSEVNEPTTYLDTLRAARERPAVLKMRLASLKSSHPDALVFALEGPADVSVYSHWIQRLNPQIQYEPFPCNGKWQVLQFREMLRRDLGGLAKKVYFFIDRDFDDYRTYGPDPNTFMTDQYSVENYVVTREVLEELLKDEFQCHAAPCVRSRLLDEFDARLTEFLNATRSLNFRLFIARRKNFALTKTIPQRVNAIANVTLESVKPTTTPIDDIIAFQGAIDDDEQASLTQEFNSFDPQTRYRGKFAYLFFLKWLEQLATERRSERSERFSAIARTHSVNMAAITLGLLASRSAIPDGLNDFLGSIDKVDSQSAHTVI